MDQTITARYTREVQKVARKTEEVDQLMAESKRLDLDNKGLIVSNTKLKETVSSLEAALHHKSNEFQILETHVKKQQLRLQHFIDQEANSAASKVTKTAEEDKRRKELEGKHNVVVFDMNKRLDALHESRKSLSEALELYKESSSVLTSENEKLREEVRLYDVRLEKMQKEFAEKVDKSGVRTTDLERQLETLSKSQMLADAENAEISTMDLQAKNGLKAEFLALVTEVDRLQNEVENERAITIEAKKEVGREAEQLVALRRISEESARLSAAEVEAVSTQQESILRDLKNAVKDRDESVKRERALSAKVSELEVALTAAATPAIAGSLSPSSSPRKLVVDDATAEEMKMQHSQLVQQQEQIRELQQVVEDLSCKLGATREDLESSSKVREGLLDNQELIDERETLRAELQEQLRSERDHLYIENQLLQGQLDDAQVVIHKSKVNATAAAAAAAPGISVQELNEVDSIVYSLLSVSNQLLHDLPSSSSSGERSASVQSDTSSISESGGGGTVLPTVRCDRYQVPALNAVHRKLGGVQYVLKKMKTRIRRLAAATARQSQSHVPSANPAALPVPNHRPGGYTPAPSQPQPHQEERAPVEYRQVASDHDSLNSADGIYASSRDPDSVLAAAAARLSTARSVSASSRQKGSPAKPMSAVTLTQSRTSPQRISGGGGIDLRSMIAESEMLLRAVDSKR